MGLGACLPSGACSASVLRAWIGSATLVSTAALPAAAADSAQPDGYSVEAASVPARGFAVVAVPGHARIPAAVGTIAVRAISPAVRRVALVAPRRDGGGTAAQAPLTLAFRCPARTRGCPATAAALADVLRDAGIAVSARNEAGEEAAPRGVSYVFEEDRAEALRIAGLMFGAETAERVPARDVKDPRPGLVEINLAE